MEDASKSSMFLVAGLDGEIEDVGKPDDEGVDGDLGGAIFAGTTWRRHNTFLWTVGSLDHSGMGLFPNCI